MILRNKRDMESWVRERTVESMKANHYLSENNFVEVASSGYFYKIVNKETPIQLENGLYAELQPFIKASKDEYGVIKVGEGLDVNDGVISHPKKHLPGQIATDENNRFVTDVQINSWNNKVDTETFNNAIDDIVDKAIKGATWKPPVLTFEDIKTTYPNPEDTWTVVVMDTNMIYMYEDSTKSWKELGAMLAPNLNFNNEKPCINEVGGIGRGTTFINVPIINILHDMFYKEVDRNNVPKFYYGLVDNRNDFDLSNYTKKEFVRFPYKLNINDINNKHVVFFFEPTMESGENIAPTDMFIQRISPELQKQFGLDSPNIDLEKAFDFKSISIRGTNHVVISSKKILSGSYEFLLGRDRNRSLVLTKDLLNEVNELKSTLYKIKTQSEGGVE